VLGLVAGDLAKRHHRPTLALSITRAGDGEGEGATAKGSGRSIPALDLHAALGECGDLLSSFGGHRAAAGLRLPAANVEALKQRFNEVVKSHLTEDDLAPVIEFDCAVRGSRATLDLAADLAALEPFGMGNPAPCLKVTDLTVRDWRPTRDGRHVQMTFESCGSGRPNVLRGFWPGAAEQAERLAPGARVEVVGALTVDTFGGGERAQLKVQGLRTA